jgi:hypothetical protein
VCKAGHRSQHLPSGMAADGALAPGIAGAEFGAAIWICLRMAAERGISLAMRSYRLWSVHGRLRLRQRGAAAGDAALEPHAVACLNQSFRNQLFSGLFC